MTVRVRTALILLLTAGLLAFFFRNADFVGVWAEVRHADGKYILLAIGITLVTYALRAWRWQYLVQPIGASHFSNAFRATVIGFAASFLLPARAGEFLRPYLLARREGLSATATFATILFERLLDLITVLLLFGAFLLFFDPGLATANPRVFAALRIGALGAAATSVIGLAIVAALAGHPERLARAAGRLERWLPAHVAALLARVVERLGEGMGILKCPGALLRATALSFPLWMSIAAGIWLVSLAFHITVPYTGSFLIMSVLVVGVAVPTPGAIGGFHAAYQIAVTAFFAAAQDQAVGAAIVLHAVSFLPVTFMGIAFMAVEGLTFAGMRRLASDRAGAVGAQT